MDLNINQEKVTKIEDFLKSDQYKAMIAGTKKFNRKLNQERKTRLPYVDGETGVAQKNNDCFRDKRERMPGQREGQIYTYPQKRWKKTSYQYLKQLNAPRNLGFGQEVHGWQPAPVVVVAEPVVSTASRSSTVSAFESGRYDDEFDDLEGSESDEEYTARHTKKGKPKKGPGGRPPGSGKGSGGGRPPKNKSLVTPQKSWIPPAPPAAPVDPYEPPQVVVTQAKKVVTPNGYCDFCMGGAGPEDKREGPKVLNKSTGKVEDLISCGECGRSGHPHCLQFTSNMVTSVRHYSWQCMECKSCTICGTSENDDQLLFCDDCDRGYHMYCLVPPMKVAPEGSWACNICVERFHKK